MERYLGNTSFRIDGYYKRKGSSSVDCAWYIRFYQEDTGNYKYLCEHLPHIEGETPVSIMKNNLQIESEGIYITNNMFLEVDDTTPDVAKICDGSMRVSDDGNELTYTHKYEREQYNYIFVEV